MMASVVLMDMYVFAKFAFFFNSYGSDDLFWPPTNGY